jgi:D-glycero-D-manno-heptose 1,7-bisphosphate phosphatase
MEEVKAIFLDKDGTLVSIEGYPDTIPTDTLMAEVVDGLRYLQERGYKLIIISNQPWISKGRLSVDETEGIFLRLIAKLNSFGVKIDDYFYCPHQTTDGCGCKKPNPKMILDAAKKHNVVLMKSFMVGDMDADIIAAKNAGIRSILVKTGRGKDYLGSGADFIIENVNKISEVL